MSKRIILFLTLSLAVILRIFLKRTNLSTYTQKSLAATQYLAVSAIQERQEALEATKKSSESTKKTSSVSATASPMEPRKGDSEVTKPVEGTLSAIQERQEELEAMASSEGKQKTPQNATTSIQTGQQDAEATELVESTREPLATAPPNASSIPASQAN